MSVDLLLERLAPAIAAVSDRELCGTLQRSLARHRPILLGVESTFARFAERAWPVAVRCTFMRSWHETHLKMLPIYGLSCRLHKLALAAQGAARDGYFRAAARNAETSYEDLNLEAQWPYTHAQLFDRLAAAICAGDDWKLDRHCLPEAAAFRQWIYYNMVAEAIPVGLYTNMFSEIYNHGEYSRALGYFDDLLQRQCGCSITETQDLDTYIRAHVDEGLEGGVEEAHFRCVLDALEAYSEAAGRAPDHALGEAVFDGYLMRIGTVMHRLREVMADAARA